MKTKKLTIYVRTFSKKTIDKIKKDIDIHQEKLRLEKTFKYKIKKFFRKFYEKVSLFSKKCY